MSSRRACRVPAVVFPVLALILSLTASSPRAQGQGVGGPGQPPGTGAGQTQVKPGDSGPPRYFEGRVLVKPRAGVRPVEMAPLHAALGGRVTDTFERIGNLQVVELPRGLVTAAAAIEFYRRSPLVAYAEPDYEMRIAQAPLQPNDLDSRLWGLHNTGQTGGTSDADIDAPEAWAVTTDASSVIVGVIDTGIDYNHPDLAANMWRNPGEVAGDGIDNDANGYVDDVHGINCITSTGNPMDDHYHGTHVAGTIGAVGDNGIGVVGVAWRVQLMALKFLDSGGSGSTTAAIRCINYAQSKGAHLTNNSWGGGGFTQALYDAINANRQAGMLFVAAAGNSSANTDSTIFYPAGYNLDNIVSVAASTHNDRLASFSNYGANTVELAAPGESILSTYPNNSYNSISGTSMASPHVAGALALLKAHRTDLTTYQALLTQLLASVTPVPALATASRTGGRLNLAAMLRTGPLAGLMVSARSVEPGVPVTFTDQSVGEITSRSLDFGDGTPPSSTTTTTHAYTTAGTYTATLTVSGPEGTDSNSQTVVVAPNYRLQSVPFAWVDSTGFTPLTMSDDSVSAAIPLPFAFPLYGQSYSTLYVGSNGLLTLGASAGGTVWTNEALPSASAPNAALYPLWDDLNAAVGGTVRHGTAPDGSYVVSWEGVPHYNSSTTTFTFQAVLEPSGGIVFQYFEVRPSTATYGAGRSATVGIEDATGSIAKQYSFNGSTLLANGTAIRFSLATAGPDPGALVAGAPTASSVGLSWSDPGTSETGFWVQRKTDTTEFATVATLAANTTSYAATGLSPLTTYTFRVVAFNDAGTAPSNEVTVTTLDAPPAAPSNLALTSVSTTSVGLSWTDNASNETEVRVQRAPSGGTYADIATLAADATSYTDAGVTAGTAYSYRVVAVNSAGLSPVSNTLSVTTVPPAPVVTVGTVTATAVTLTWTNVAGETGYRIDRTTGGTTTSVSLSANTTSYTWSGLTSATAYSFTVVAINASGASASVPVTATTLASTIPLAPTGLVASGVTTSSITVSWNASTGATSYRLERSTDGVRWSQIATPTTTSFTSTRLKSRTLYYFRVRAVNASGVSAYSAVLTQRTN